ncbi:MAG: PLDc N-terminal domain-containing protein [Rubripirellula sp.]
MVLRCFLSCFRGFARRSDVRWAWLAFSFFVPFLGLAAKTLAVVLDGQTAGDGLPGRAT